jgi:hypothetical protein
MRQKELARIGARQMQGQGTKLDLGKAMDVDMMPLSGKELKCVEYLVAMESRVLEVGDAMRERLKKIPNGWRQFRLLVSTLDRLMPEVYDTVPNKTRMYLKNIMENGEVLIRFIPVSRNPEWKLVKDEDLAVLINLAMAGECAICMKQGREAKKCKLRGALENIAPPREGHPAGGCGYMNVVLGCDIGHYVREG